MANTAIEVKKTGAAQKPAPAEARRVNVWNAFRTEMDRLFDRFGSGFRLAPWRSMFDVEPAFRYETSFGIAMPAVDVTEDATAYKISAEVPGMSEKDVEVSVSGDMLTFKGEKSEAKEQKEKNYHISERSYGAFERSFRLPEGVDRDKISAEFAKGVLTITLPKTAEAQSATKKIEVKSAS